MRVLTPAALRESVSEAFTTLRRNPLRGGLAALAMAVAVATTAVVQTGLDGLARSARLSSARAFGTDAFVMARVAGTTLSRRELADRLARHPNITRSDVRFLERVADGRVIYAATAQQSADVTAGARRFERASVSGTAWTLPDIRDIGLDRGRFFTRDEDLAGVQVAVIGRGLADTLFPAVDPIGADVRIGRRGFRVIGVQGAQGTSGGQSLDRYVWIPLAAYERTFGAAPSLQVFATGGPGVSAGEAEAHARISMRARRHLAPGAPDVFDIITPEASRTFVERLTTEIGAAGPPIALMALLAAMVVVTNTTLVSVTQRTREIGVRRAVGARRGHVVVETIAEAFIVAAAGGAAGLTLAGLLLSVASGPIGVPLALEAPVVAGSLGAALVSGICAGWYPARRAASLDVVNALKQE